MNERDKGEAMRYTRDGDTIIALSTPPGESGIAVIRLSGPEAIEIITGMAPESPRYHPKRTYRKQIRSLDGELLDETVVTVMVSPESYTGEDVVEISCHGSMRVASDIIEAAVVRGARVADAGEFTKRAFLNGKIDLAQAEAVADLIASETKLQRRVALEHLEGGLSRRIGELEDTLLDQLANVEVSIDFTDEDVETFSREELGESARRLEGRLRELLSSEAAGNKLREGIRITIVGARNAGKSSLYNALLGEERAIVSKAPGTTRDILREKIHIGGFSYYLEDTAGIAETDCEIETMGISIGRRAASIADMVLFVIDGHEDWREKLAEELSSADGKRTIFVLNKMDLGLRVGLDEAEAAVGKGGIIAVSALTLQGLEDLRSMIYERTAGGGLGEINRERIAVNARQAAALREAAEGLERLIEELDAGAPPEILSMEIKSAAGGLGKVTGRSIEGELLDRIFSEFCIGK